MCLRTCLLKLDEKPRLAFNRIVVVRYRIQLEARGLAAATINQRLAAVRRLAHEAADSGLLSPELPAGIQRVKGAKQLGHRSGNWLSLEQSADLLGSAARTFTSELGELSSQLDSQTSLANALQRGPFVRSLCPASDPPLQ